MSKKIVGIEISYIYDYDDTPVHAGYFDSFNEAIDFLKEENNSSIREMIETIRAQIYDVEEEIFNNGLSESRKAALKLRRAKLIYKLDSLLAP